MSYSLSKIREKGEEKEGRRGRRREGWRCVPHYLCLAGCGHSFVDIRKLKLRKHACRRSLYEVACSTVGLRCIVLLDNLFLTDTKWLHSTRNAKPQSREACIAKIFSTCPYNSKTSATTINYFTTWSTSCHNDEAYNIS